MTEHALIIRNFSVLALIPFVAYLLWLDYVSRQLKVRQADNLDTARAWASDRARWGAITAGFSQICLFFAAMNPQNPVPLVSFAIVGAVVLAQVLAHARFESRLQTEREKVLIARAGQGIRAILWIALSGAVCLGIVVGTVKLGFVAAHALDASFAAKTLVALFAVIAGIALGLVWNFLLAPLHLRRILPCSSLADSELTQGINTLFAKHGMPSPGVAIIEPESSRQSANALIAGFRGARGPIRPTLFLSRSLIQGLSDREILAVVSHEASHVLLSHLKKRLILGIGLVGAMVLAATFVFVLVAVFAPTSQLHPWLGPIAGYVAFWMGLKSVARQSRLQEIEADIHAVQSFGADWEDLSSALRKLDLINGRSTARRGNAPGLSGHPSTETRIQILQSYVNRKLSGKVEETPAAASDTKIAA